MPGTRATSTRPESPPVSSFVPKTRSTTGGQAYVDVTLTAGYAIDGTGRELVLDADQTLSPAVPR